MVLRPENGLSLCAGGGGLDMGLMLAEPGFHTRCHVEWEDYPRQTLIAAQRAGYFAPAPVWDDVRTFDGRPWRGYIDTILAGYPCQPFSAAGQRKGENDERHLWPEVARIIREVGPRWVFLENVAGHVSLGADAVLRELWGMGFTPAAGLFSAEEVGAPHERLRWFCVAYRASPRCDGAGQRTETDRESRERMSGEGCGDVGDTGHPERRTGATTWHDSDRQDARRAQADRGAGEPGDHVGHAESECAGRSRDSDGDGACASHSGPVCPSGRVGDVGHAAQFGRREGRPEHELRSGRASPAVSGRAMAHASEPGPQGREQRGSPGERDRAPASRSASQLRGAPLFPPGPADMAAWRHVLAGDPELAPAVSLGDLATFARYFAAIVEAGELEQAEAESSLCGLADGLADRARALRLLGNGVCPLAAAYAWRSLAASHGLWPVDLEAGEVSREAPGT